MLAGAIERQDEKLVPVRIQYFIDALSTLYRNSHILWPYLKYTDFGDDKVRSNHHILNGLVAASDWPGWVLRFAPPHGYNCRCILEPINQLEAQSKGWTEVFPLGDDKAKAFLSAGGSDDQFPREDFI